MTIPRYLKTCFFLCRKIGFAFSSIQHFLIQKKILNHPSWYSFPKNRSFEIANNIWNARILRRALSVLIRSRCKKDILQLVNRNVQFPKDTGCILLVCHTPWKRVLVQWCLQNEFLFIVSGGRWKGATNKIQNTGMGFSEQKKAISHLQHGGKIIIAADVFNGKNDCPVTFLGQKKNISTFPLRLARIAKVPLMLALPCFQQEKFSFITGYSIIPSDANIDPSKQMQDMVSYLEHQIQDDPCIWQDFVR